MHTNIFLLALIRVPRAPCRYGNFTTVVPHPSVWVNRPNLQCWSSCSITFARSPRCCRHYCWCCLRCDRAMVCFSVALVWVRWRDLCLGTIFTNVGCQYLRHAPDRIIRWRCGPLHTLQTYVHSCSSMCSFDCWAILTTIPTAAMFSIALVCPGVFGECCKRLLETRPPGVNWRYFVLRLLQSAACLARHYHCPLTNHALRLSASLSTNAPPQTHDAIRKAFATLGSSKSVIWGWEAIRCMGGMLDIVLPALNSLGCGSVCCWQICAHIYVDTHMCIHLSSWKCICA